MLESYFQNLSVSMTKDAYYEMCADLGTEPVEEEVPIEMEDFPIEVQEAIDIYHRLRDEWDSMNGRYTGKSFIGLQDIFDILEIDKVTRRWVLDWIRLMDITRSKVIKASAPKQT